MRHFVPAALVLALSATAVIAQASDPAAAPIRALDEGLIAIMKSGRAAGVKGRAAAIAPAIDRAYDLPLMTRLAQGTLGESGMVKL